MEIKGLDVKKIVKFGGLGVIGLIVVVILFMSWENVNPGEEGFLYSPYGGGVETQSAYDEGNYFVVPWNDIIAYNIRQQSRSYESQVMDKNGTDIGLVVAINYHAEKGGTANLHLKHGDFKGAIKDVIGRYSYIEVYSTKREALEQEIEDILYKDFEGNFIVLDFVEIADVNLLVNIATEATVKETQKQKNKTAQLMKEEQILEG